MKSPVNKFAIKSKLNKDIFDLNAKKISIDVKSRYDDSECIVVPKRQFREKKDMSSETVTQTTGFCDIRVQGTSPLW